MTLNTIQFLQVTIEPWRYSDTEQRVLRIEVQVNNRRYNVEKILVPDELTSYFDQLFEIAKEEIKSCVL